jgi:hypothetical protein
MEVYEEITRKKIMILEEENISRRSKNINESEPGEILPWMPKIQKEHTSHDRSWGDEIKCDGSWQQKRKI